MAGRRTIWLIALIAIVGLASCGDRTPGRPLVAIGWMQLLAPTPGSSSGPPDSLLEANRALWSSSGIHSYRYRFRWECFCTTDYVRIVDITVLNGAIVSVVDASTGSPVSPDAAAHYRTIDGLFDLMRQAIDYPAASVRSAYDVKFGYPAESSIDYAAQVADDELSFRVYGLSPIRSQ